MDAEAFVAYNVKILADNIRKIRLARGLSQEAFAVDADVDRAYVGRLERATENPSVRVLSKIAAALGVEIAALFTPPTPGEAEPEPLKKGPKGQRS